ncbi:MAG: DUF1127 domain-containing protein [Allorhizobium sp.]
MRTTERMIDLDLAQTRVSLTARLATGVYRVKSVWRAVNNRLAANSLADLDERMLTDIGLSRSEVEAVLRTTRMTEDPMERLIRSARKNSLQALTAPSRR